MIKDTTETKKKAIKMEEPVSDVVDVDLSVIKRKRFRINGDNNLIIELNTSDMGIISRLNKAVPKLEALQVKAGKLSTDGDDALASSAKTLEEIDLEMKELIDYIFDANISEKCADGGSMFDLLGGVFRYEHILDKFMQLYEENLAEEYKKLKLRVNKYAKKK